MQVKKQQLEPDMGQQTGSKLGKEYVKAVYCHPAYLTSVQSTSCEIPDVQTGFRKGRGTRDQLPTSAGSSKKQESSRKTSTLASLTTLKSLTLWITTNCGKF